MLLGGGLLAASQAMAGDLLLWQTNSLSYLYGKDFAVNPSIQQTITFEHADRWKYGDNFLFVDSTYYNGEKDRNKGVHAYYGEFSPRLSFGKILDRRFEFGPIKDVLLAMTYENGEDDTEAYLIGPGFDLAVPGFNFFTLNFYYRQTEGSRPGDDVWQITPAWSYTLPLGNSNLLIDGYIDWVVDNDQNSQGYLSRQPALQPADQVRPGQGHGLAGETGVRRRRIQLLERQIRHRKQHPTSTPMKTPPACW
jgi:Nucleoside-binding outer membrane protein